MAYHHLSHFIHLVISLILEDATFQYEILYRSTYIAAMSKLSHSKAAPDYIIFSLLQPLVMMSLCSKELNCTSPVKHFTRQWVRCE